MGTLSSATNTMQQYPVEEISIIKNSILLPIMNTSFFIGNYFVAFYMTWRLAIVALPFVFLLILLPGIFCGQTLLATSSNSNEPIT